MMKSFQYALNIRVKFKNILKKKFYCALLRKIKHSNGKNVFLEGFHLIGAFKNIEISYLQRAGRAEQRAKLIEEKHREEIYISTRIPSTQ